MTVVARWWPVGAFIALSVMAQTLILGRYEAAGHAADHLSSAQVPFFGAVLIAIIVWSTPRVRRQLDVLIACGVWLAMLVGVAIGNLRVVDAINGADWTDEQAEALGEGLRGFQSGHDLAQVSSFLAVAAAVLLAVLLRFRGHIGSGVAVGSATASLLFPPWIVPGFGVLVLAIALCVARHRRIRVSPRSGRSQSLGGPRRTG